MFIFFIGEIKFVVGVCYYDMRNVFVIVGNYIVNGGCFCVLVEGKCGVFYVIVGKNIVVVWF